MKNPKKAILAAAALLTFYSSPSWAEYVIQTTQPNTRTMVKSASELLSTDAAQVYWDRKTYASIEDQLKASMKSSTVYVGNLAFDTSENLIHSHFALAGSVKRVIMGINKNTKQPCGFCFVEYDDVESR